MRLHVFEGGGLIAQTEPCERHTWFGHGRSLDVDRTVGPLDDDAAGDVVECNHSIRLHDDVLAGVAQVNLAEMIGHGGVVRSESEREHTIRVGLRIRGMSSMMPVDDPAGLRLHDCAVRSERHRSNAHERVQAVDPLGTYTNDERLFLDLETNDWAEQSQVIHCASLEPHPDTLVDVQEGFDGQKQRSALTAAEQALRSLGSGDAAKARQAAAKASDLDQIGLYMGFVEAVEPLATKLEAGGQVDEAGWDDLSTALGMGPLAALIDELRG